MGDINLGQRLFVAWWHQAITWTNVNFSFVRFCGIHLRAISQWVSKLLFYIMSLNVILWTLITELSGANELKWIIWLWIRSTENGVVDCTCGSNIEEESVDIGIAGNWPLFPLVSLRLGDTGEESEYIYFQIGPLICKQGLFRNIPDSKVHGANMGPIWGRQDPRGPRVGPMNFAIWDIV